MEISKCSNSVDRLSELPNSLIFHIFSLMPMTDVVKTTILSNRWKDLWTTAPTLRFMDFQMETDDDTDLFLTRVRDFINRALIFWRGPRIDKFVINLGKRFNNSIHSDIDLWLHFAKKFEVQTLYGLLGVDSVQPTQNLYCVPQCLYSCSSLQSLFLQGCYFNLPIKNVSWNQLKYLNIDDGYGLSEDLINKVLSGCPQLEVFILDLVENTDNLNIESSSLRYLSICKYLNGSCDVPSMDTELRISTPNLEILELEEVPYRKCVMSNVPSLTRVNLLFDGPTYYSHQLFSGNDFVGETLKQILPSIKHVETVSLSDWCIKALGDMKNKNMLSPSPNVEELELHGCFEEYKQIVSLLEIFPKLEILNLEQDKGSKKYHGNQHQHGRDSVKFEANLPDSFVQELRTVVITWAEGEESMLPLIEILLKYASKLKKMVFRVEETKPPSNSLLLALLRMPRSSPTAELIFSTTPGE